MAFRLSTVACMLLVLPVAFTFPTLWVAEKNGCGAHPTGPEGNHLAPVSDKATKYIVKRPGGAAATTVTPGATYAVTLVFPQPRLALVTASTGTVSTDAACPNRFVTAKNARAPTITINWAVPCSAKGTAVLKTTSTFSPSAAFQDSSFSAPVGPPAASCKGAATKGH